MSEATGTGTGAHPLVDLNTGDPGREGERAFELLQAGRIIAFRNVPEIHELTRAIRELAAAFGGVNGEQGVSAMLRSREVPSLEVLSVFHRVLRHLRDSRYMGCLFSDFMDRLGLPAPVLLDAGYCRIMVPRHYRDARSRSDLFDPAEFGPPDPYEAEHMLQEAKWGDAHRDIDARHYHFQVNLWFPLHDVGKEQTLLIFPEAYRRNVSQYRPLPGPENPRNWGYGEPLQVPLRLGDMLMFHSQQLHASPSQAPDQNRFTVELRAAAACIDDNGRVYRRSFWRLENFRPRRGRAVDAPQRAHQLAQPSPDQPGLDYALAGATAHALVHRLFRRAQCSLAAGYLHRDQGVLDDALALDERGWGIVVDRLGEFSCGEDLWLLVTRLMLRQRQQRLAAAVLHRIQGNTSSYFWALEAGRIAIEAGLHDVALSAFGAAAANAARSDVALDRYTRDMPPPRSPVVLQLLPARAKRAARRFSRRAQRLHSRRIPSGIPSEFDHRQLWDPSLVWPNSERGRRLKNSVMRVLGPAASGAIGRLFRFFREH